MACIMKTIYSIITGIIFVGVSFTASAYYPYYYESFNGMGTNGTIAPPGWSYWYLEGNGAEVTAPTGAQMAAALPGETSLAVWNQQTEPVTAFYRQMANVGATPEEVDRLLGTNPTQNWGDIIQLSLPNNSGSAISSVQISYDMEVMAVGILKAGGTATHEDLPGYRFYFLDGSTWTPFAGLDSSNDELYSTSTTSGEIHFSTPVPDGGNLQFRWFDDNAGWFTPDWTFAIEHVDVRVPEPSTLSLLAVGAWALISRRRKA